MIAGRTTPSVLRILWNAFFAATCLYAVIPWFAIAEHVDSAAAATQALVSGLRLGAIGAAVASFLLRRQFMTGLQAALQPGAAPTDLWRQLLIGCTVTWMITEVVAGVGLAIAMVTRNPYEVVPYAGAALFLLYMHRLAMWPVAEIEQAMGGPG
jgi:hypothetical protein